MIHHLRELFDHRELLYNLVKRELKVKYKRSVFGFFWSFANPLVLVAVYSLIAGKLMGMDRALLPDPLHGYPGYLGFQGKASFAVFLISSLIAWNYLTNALVMSVGSIVDSGGLVKKIYFPREIIPFAHVFASLVTFVIELSVLMVFLTVLGFYFFYQIPVLLAIIVIETFFLLGLSLFVSYSNVFFRDTKHLLNIVIMIWFWACPIIYPYSKVLAAASHRNLSWLSLVYRLNPMTSIILVYQRVLYKCTFAGWSILGYTAVFSFGLFTVSYLFFKKKEENIAGEI